MNTHYRYRVIASLRFRGNTVCSAQCSVTTNYK